MAVIGLKKPVYAIAQETADAITYNAGAVLAKAISLSAAPNVSDVKLYADDMVAEAVKSVSDVTLTLNVDDLSDEARVAILGNTLDTNGEIVSKGDDTPPYVGLGIVAGVMRNNVRAWRAIWFTKVMFGAPTETFNTKGQNVEFQTPTLEGTALVDVTGVWKIEKLCTTEEAAITWINGKAGIS